VFVFPLVWLPIVLVLAGTGWQDHKFVQLGLLSCGIQPIVSTCIAMTKSDVKKYTMDLITLSYIRRPSPSEETHTENIHDTVVRECISL
jgi:hypothetical protein